tara:strand:- start:1573 stop:1707 length:135 start_codon:yes stop_codon:yes gene_type:complete
MESKKNFESEKLKWTFLKCPKIYFYIYNFLKKMKKMSYDENALK